MRAGAPFVVGRRAPSSPPYRPVTPEAGEFDVGLTVARRLAGGHPRRAAQAVPLPGYLDAA